MSNPLVYISGPITNGSTSDTRAVETNIRNAQSVAVDLMKAGFSVYCPHSSGLWEREREIAYDDWLAHDFSVIDRCDAVYRIPGESRGADAEVEYAKSKGIPVYVAGSQSYERLRQLVGMTMLENQLSAWEADVESKKAAAPDGIVTYASGAIRSADRENTRYSLIPYEGMRRRAEANAEGEKKYGTYNWQKGMLVSKLLDHAIAHLFLYAKGDATEDHLGHAGWNIDAACWMEENKPEYVDMGPLTAERAEASVS